MCHRSLTKWCKYLEVVLLILGVTTGYFCAAQVVFIGEAEIPFEVTINGKTTKAIAWAGRLSRDFKLGHERNAADMIGVRVLPSGTVWWIARYVFDKSLPEVLAEFAENTQCAIHSGKVTCVVVNGRTLTIRTVENRIADVEFRQFLLEEAERLPDDLLDWSRGINSKAAAAKQIVVRTPNLDTFYHGPGLGDPLPDVRIQSLKPQGNGWQVTIRRKDGESGIVILDGNLIVKSGRRIGKVK